MSNIWGADQSSHFYSLSIDTVLNAIESLGLTTTGRVIQLNSMENRVYEVEVNLDFEPKSVSENFKIIKFYRPNRWTKEQIQEEHDFIHDLVEYELQAIAPLKFNNKTLFTNPDGLYFAIFDKKGGRAADEWTTPLLEQMGRLLARMHNIGASKKAKHRLKLDIDTFGKSNLDYLLRSNTIPLDYQAQYKEVCEEIFSISSPLFKNIDNIRVHGDCHHGNTLLNNGPFLIDFDDMLVAPSVQDIWMITPGRDDYSLNQRNVLIDSYLEMRDFNFNELKLIEVLRALRMIHFTSWIAHRYDDESFKRTFENFKTNQYFEKEIFDLNQQLMFIKDDLSKTIHY